MSILLRDLKLYGSATMPDNDTPTAIGGAVEYTRRPIFTDLGVAMEVVSDATQDTTQTMTVTYRDSGGVIQTEAQTLNGRTPVPFSATPERVLKAIITGGSISGTIAIEAQTPTLANTLQAATTDDVTLNAGASAVDDAYRGYVFRVTGGGGAAGQIAEIIKYNGTSKVATLSRAVSGLGATTTFAISPGMVFDCAVGSVSPHQVTEVRRVFYDSSADQPGGSNRKYYDKIFAVNTHASLTLTQALLHEQADPSGLVAFGVAGSLNDTGTNGGGNNRQVAPAGITFNSSDKNVIGSALTTGDRQGIWVELTLNAGTAAQKTTYTLRLQGTTV